MPHRSMSYKQIIRVYTFHKLNPRFTKRLAFERSRLQFVHKKFCKQEQHYQVLFHIKLHGTADMSSSIQVYRKKKCVNQRSVSTYYCSKVVCVDRFVYKRYEYLSFSLSVQVHICGLRSVLGSLVTDITLTKNN